jgi:hypothetical protein
VAGHVDPAPRRNRDAGQTVEGGSLSGPVRAHQADDLAGENLKGQLLDRGEISVHLLQAVDLNH